MDKHSPESRHPNSLDENVPRGTMMKLFSLLRGRFIDRTADEDISALRIRYTHCRLPRPSWSARNPRRVFGPNPKHEMSTARERFCRPTEQLLKLTDCSTGDDVRENRFRANLLKSLGANLNIAKSKSSYYFTQKCTFLLIGLNQSKMNARARNFESKARKSGPRPNVDQSTVFHRQ
jgi:hypothetical protein